MLSRATCIVALHLLCIANVVKPLVLFSANVEDIKKIARKFISENVADQIVDFLAKATAAGKEKLSAENDQNAYDIEQASYEKEIARAGRKKIISTTSEGTTKDLYGDYAFLTEKIYVGRKPDPLLDNVMNAVNADVMGEDNDVQTPEAETTRRPHKKRRKKGRKQIEYSEGTEGNQYSEVTEFVNGYSGRVDFGEFVEDEAMNLPNAEQNIQGYQREGEDFVATSGPVNLPRVS